MSIRNELIDETRAYSFLAIGVAKAVGVAGNRRLGDPLRWARIMILRQIAAFHGLKWSDYVIGRNWTDPAEIVALIGALPPETTELFFHPVACAGNQMFKHDLPVLLDERVRRAVAHARGNTETTIGRAV